MRSASNIDWLGKHGRTIAEERSPASRTQTGRHVLVKGQRRPTQVVFSGFIRRGRGGAGIFLDVLELQLEAPAHQHLAKGNVLNR